MVSSVTEKAAFVMNVCSQHQTTFFSELIFSSKRIQKHILKERQKNYTLHSLKVVSRYYHKRPARYYYSEQRRTRFY